MWPLYLGILLFAGPHLWSMLAPGHAAAMRQKLGSSLYKGLYSLFSLIGLVLMSMGYLRGRSGPNSLQMFYEPWLEGRHLMFLLVLVGFILIFSNNSKGYIAKTLQHPFSIGVVLLSFGHLLVNGERAVVLIFGSFLLLAVLNIVLGFSRGTTMIEKPNWLHDVRGIVVGMILYVVFMFGFHPYVLNIPVAG
jgi:uncharacterized membrane protein